MRNKLYVMAALAAAASGDQAMAETFKTRNEAMDVIAALLPRATAANPEYRAKSDGTLSRWLTQDVRFATGADGAVTVTMRETFTQAKDGKTTQGRHEAAFSLAEVDVSEFTQPDDLTAADEPALGLLFACRKPGCVAAQWDDAASKADKADISLHDGATRARLLAAFRRLQSE